MPQAIVTTHSKIYRDLYLQIGKKEQIEFEGIDWTSGAYEAWEEKKWELFEKLFPERTSTKASGWKSRYLKGMSDEDIKKWADACGPAPREEVIPEGLTAAQAKVVSSLSSGEFKIAIAEDGTVTFIVETS